MSLNSSDQSDRPRRLPAVLIGGPTASGKSALALRLAETCQGVIINADSMQVYGDLRIITARPTPAEERRVPHRLYGHVDAASPYSVGHWLSEARVVLTQAADAEQIPIIVGGTGLYFKLMLSGLSAVPPIPAPIRAALRQRLAAEGPHALHAELSARDPASAARLKAADGVRIIRALEVIETTGRSLTDWHHDGMPALWDPAQTVRVFLAPDREVLYQRIDRRFDAMLGAGALDEVRALASRNLDPVAPAMKAHGVPWLIRALAGEMTLAEAAHFAKQDTRRYTKRQFTWFRNQLPDFVWVEPEAAEEAIGSALREWT
jgi:tRNA dimethylallyltransferase